MRIFILAGAVAMLFAPEAAAEASSVEPFAEIVRGIRAADYRAERAELRRLAGLLEGAGDWALVEYRHYWRGFALWRRALNGFNETPVADDLEADLRAAIVSFQAAQAARPDWIEARIGVLGCAGPLFFLARDDAARREALLKEYLPVSREVSEKAADNSRALWLRGQALLGAPPPAGGDPAQAAATFRRGIEAALSEASRIPAGEPAWVPRWGGAENLMNLAYLYSHSTLANRDLALAYAEGALVAAPDWHYVRHVLRPLILALPQPSPGAEQRGPR